VAAKLPYQGHRELSIVQKSPELSGVAGQMRDRASSVPPASRIERLVAGQSIVLGRQVAEERRRRRLTLRQLAEMAGLGRATVHDIESGREGSLGAYIGLAEALSLKAEFNLVDPRRREPAGARIKDPVHAAMGEAEAARMRSQGFHIGLDEPYQHYQFAGRADFVAWSTAPAALLHIENKTALPDIQEAIGTFNAKHNYLGVELAARAGIGRWRSETHVLAVLWSADVMRDLRSHSASFESVWPDTPDAFERWWLGNPPADGRRKVLILLDPVAGVRRDRRRWVGLAETASVRPRYRGYAEAASALRRDLPRLDPNRR
jgi:transcriptional regulator with XRE-family HTH domain